MSGFSLAPLVVLALFAAQTLDAQNPATSRISGVVRDQSGAAITGARVNLSGGSAAVTQFTDAKGEFIFSAVSTPAGVLKISASGFQDQTRGWQAGASRVEVTLLPAVAAEQITVTADRTSVRVVETATSVIILSQEDLSATAALTTDDMLLQVPGFSLFRRTDSRTANPTTQGASLRGLSASGASRALVLADGFPLNDPFGAWVYWSRVPREDISSIEAASGGASHLYGSNALGGVVNIRRKPVDQDAVSLEASYGNENTPEISFASSKAMGAWSGGITGQLFRTDGYIPVPSAFRGAVDTPVRSQDAIGDLVIGRKFGEHANIFARGSVFGESRHNGTPLQMNSTTIRELDLGADWLAGNWGAFEFRGYASRQNLDQTFSAVASDRNSESLTRSQRVPAQRVGFLGQWSKSLGTHQNLVAGLEEWNIHGEDDEVAFTGPLRALDAGGREVNWAGYGEDIVRITSRWLLTLAGRIDHWQNFDGFNSTQPLPGGVVARTPLPDRSETFFSPRLALLHKLTKNVSLTASGYRAFRAPTLNELYRSFRAGIVVTNANHDLRAERLTGWETGAIVTGWDQRFMLRGNFFWNDVTRPVANVTLSSTPTLITRMRENLGRTRSRGVEFEASARVSKAVDVSGEYEYVGAAVTSFSVDPTLVGKDIPEVPRNNFNFQVRYTKPFVVLGVQGRFVGNAFDDDQNTLLLRRYFTMDATASHKLWKAAEGFVAVENLLNQRYDVQRSGVLTVGPPILARVGVRLQWGAR